jgi:hypothetical protein
MEAYCSIEGSSPTPFSKNSGRFPGNLVDLNGGKQTKKIATQVAILKILL